MSERKIVKRSGAVAPYSLEKITDAIYKAMTENGFDDRKFAVAMADKVEKNLNFDEIVTVDKIQDQVEIALMKSNHPEVAKAYILYRHAKDIARSAKKQHEGLIPESFLSEFKHVQNPMDQLGSFVYYRTYSRWLEDEKRRESWLETVLRAVEYNCSLVPTSKEEAMKLFRNIFELKQFLSGRTFWVGNTGVSKEHPMSNYNCSFEVIDTFNAYRDLFYLLMVGSGVGVRVLKTDTDKLPKVRTNVEIIHQAYEPLPKNQRKDSTSFDTMHNDTAVITVGDSKEGWAQSIELFFKVLYSFEYRDITTLVINYDNVRPKGAKLKTFGGTASGYTSMKNMFTKIDKVVKNAGRRTIDTKVKLRPIDCLDIANIIGENVVSGGVRRTAEIALLDQDDKECIQAKSELYKKVGEKWVIDAEIAHRQMSNNSIYYTKKPTREQLNWHLNQMRYSGEPGWVNEEAGLKRRPNFKGVNPCAEILLDSKAMCNLTTVNVMAFVVNGILDRAALMEAQKLSARAGYRMTCTEMELPDWDAIQQRDKLLGCSLTGWQDMVNATGLTAEEQVSLLSELKETARASAKAYADELGMKEPLLITTVKPEGTLSNLPGVSSGVHFSHAPYYVRRVRISSDDALVKVCEELGYPVFPEVGQALESCKTKIVEFPCKAPAGKVKADVSALEQLEIYKMFMTYYVEHNCSITVHVRDHEWADVEQWVWDNWDDTVALSFLSYDDNFYEMLPFEEITLDEYEKRVKEMKPFVPSLIAKYEKEETDFDIGASECSGGQCPVR